MRIAYFDCFAGISGDMCLGAMVDCGLDPDLLISLPNRLGLTNTEVQVERTERNGISAARVHVRCSDSRSHRHLHHIENIIERSDLSAEVKARSLTAFRQLAEAEARVHNQPVEKVHFHEVGGEDAIIDIVGAALGYEALQIQKAFTGPVSLGGGTVDCAHGTYPVPAPATALLLQGLPVRHGPVDAELTTPTGAALLASFTEGAERVPPYRPVRSGYGAGSRSFTRLANVLRITIGETEEPVAMDRVCVLECHIDDMTAEVIPHVMERVMQSGAVDVALTSILMKKGRPGYRLTVLASPEQEWPVASVLFSETTTLGIRRLEIPRYVLKRRELNGTTSLGAVRYKEIELPDGQVRRVAEFESCRELAKQHNLPLREVFERVQRDLMGLDKR